MVEPTQKGITNALRRWGKLREERDRIEAELNAAVEPHRIAYEQKIAAAVEGARPLLAAVEEKIHALEKEITAAMMAGIDERGEVRINRVSTATSIVEIATRVEREIDPRRFIEEVPESERSEAFWSCLKTLVGRAERFLGKDRLDRIASARRTHSVSFSRT